MAVDATIGVWATVAEGFGQRLGEVVVASYQLVVVA